jgi:hypothetical protein
VLDSRKDCCCFFLNDERLLFLVLAIGVYLHHGAATTNLHVSR